MNLSNSSYRTNGCSSSFGQDFSSQYFPAVYSPVLLVTAVINALACPLTILLNLLVLMAVAMKYRLQTCSNVLLACLALTDLAVGLVVQPIYLAMCVLLYRGKRFSEFCELEDAFAVSFAVFSLASFLHLVFISCDRYLAIKHPFAHFKIVTKTRLGVVSVFAWILSIVAISPGKFEIIATIVLVLAGISLCTIVFFQIVVYAEVRRHEKAIISQQVSSEVKEKFKKEKKALKLTTTIIVTLFLCYLPTVVFRVIIEFFSDSITNDVETVIAFLTASIPVLNSLVNPVIYTFRSRQFRIAFIELLARKTLYEAEEIERWLTRPAGIVVPFHEENKAKDSDSGGNFQQVENVSDPVH